VLFCLIYQQETINCVAVADKTEDISGFLLLAIFHGHEACLSVQLLAGRAKCIHLALTPTNCKWDKQFYPGVQEKYFPIF
jgi:hypothetical protein